MSFVVRTFKPAAALARASRLSARFYASEAAAAPAAGKLVVNFALPHEAVLKSKEVNQVDLSAVSGDLGILADHVSTIEQLKPGVIDIIADSGSTKYFVSGGFAIMNPNSVLNINAIEAFKLDDIDPQAVAANLAESQRLASSAKDELTKEAAAIEIELYESLQTALSAKSKESKATTSAAIASGIAFELCSRMLSAALLDVGSEVAKAVVCKYVLLAAGQMAVLLVDGQTVVLLLDGVTDDIEDNSDGDDTDDNADDNVLLGEFKDSSGLADANSSMAA